MGSVIEVVLQEVVARVGPGQTLIWRAALERMVSLGFDTETIRLLASLAHGPRQLSALAGLVGRDDEGAARLVAAGDASDEGLASFVRGLLVLLEHLEADGRTTELAMALGYLACCEESPGVGGHQGSLSDRVRAHIEDHGFDG